MKLSVGDKAMIALGCGGLGVAAAKAALRHHHILQIKPCKLSMKLEFEASYDDRAYEMPIGEIIKPIPSLGIVECFTETPLQFLKRHYDSGTLHPDYPGYDELCIAEEIMSLNEDERDPEDLEICEQALENLNEQLTAPKVNNYGWGLMKIKDNNKVEIVCLYPEKFTSFKTCLEYIKGRIKIWKNPQTSTRTKS